MDMQNLQVKNINKIHRKCITNSSLVYYQKFYQRYYFDNKILFMALVI